MPGLLCKATHSICSFGRCCFSEISSALSDLQFVELLLPLLALYVVVCLTDTWDGTWLLGQVKGVREWMDESTDRYLASASSTYAPTSTHPAFNAFE